MNFEKDIIPLTSQGTYEVNVRFRNFKSTIDEYVNDYGLQLNPDFQRGHVWNENQERSYIEFILRGGNISKTFYLNHPGWMNNMIGDFVCVDGLQRITSILKFLNNELYVFDNVFLDDFDDKEYLLRMNDVKINVNNLQTRKEVLQWYIDFNSGGTIHSDKEIDRVKNLLKKCGE